MTEDHYPPACRNNILVIPLIKSTIELRGWLYLGTDVAGTAAPAGAGGD